MPFTGYIVNPSGQQQWARSVGNFTVNFGAIASLTYEWLLQLRQDISRLKEAMLRLFGARVDLVLRLLEGLIEGSPANSIYPRSDTRLAIPGTPTQI